MVWGRGYECRRLLVEQLAYSLSPSVATSYVKASPSLPPPPLSLSLFLPLSLSLSFTHTHDPTESPEPTEFGEITMKSRQRVRSASPSRLRATLKATQRLIMSRSARIRMRASVVVPGASEGVLPPDAEPVTAQEALHHLAKMVSEGERGE